MRRLISQAVLGFFTSLFFFCASSAFAQDQLGDVAREERDRKANESRRSYVYTNEDLSQPRIVIRKSGEPVTAAESAAAPVSNESPADQELARPSRIVWPDEIPLGDIARFYRRQREVASTRGSEFAPYEPPVLDMDFLLPSPLASPLLDFARTLPPLPFIPEPEWGQFAASARAVRVRPGDSLWKIAERHLGRGEDWGRIAAANPELKDPDLIQIGQQLLLPSSEASPVSSASPPERLVRVQSGDSLWKLASAQLGSGYSWNCLAAANPRIKDVNRIYPGQLIVIPADCSTGA